MTEPERTHLPRSRRQTAPPVPSPLDPFLRDFLGWVGDQVAGLNPPRGLSSLAETFDWQPAFVEVLFTAARSRGLLQPVPVRGARGKLSWTLSTRGARWLESPPER